MALKVQVQDKAAQQNQEDDWTLTADQMIFMLQHHNSILAAYEEEDMDFLGELEASDEYQAAFGDMGWDEAFDRYESMLEEHNAA